MKKVAHLADIHLRDSQYGHMSRRQDFFQGLMNALEAARQHGAEIIIMAGDVTNSTRPSPFIIDSLRKVEDWLIGNKIVALVVSGNHDNTAPHWIEVVTNASSEYGMKFLNDSGCVTDDVAFWGLPMIPAADSLRQIFAEPGRQADVLIMHGDVKEFTGFPVKNALEVSEFPGDKYKLIAMGHIHVHKHITRADGLVVAYPGSTELCSSSEDENKHLYLYTFDKHILKNIESIPFATRPAMLGKIRSTTHMDKVLDFMNVNKEEGALVNVQYDSAEVPDCLSRLNAANIKGTHIIQCTPIPVIRTAAGQETSLTSEVADRPIESFLPVFMKEDEPAYKLAYALLNPDADAQATINEYITERRNSPIAHHVNSEN